MFRRNIAPIDESYCETCSRYKTSEHIFSTCPVASDVWRSLGIATPSYGLTQPWFLVKEWPLPSSVHLDDILLLLWHLWKARNVLIFFYRKSITTANSLRCVIGDLDAWSCHYRKNRTKLRLWRDYIFSRLMASLYSAM
ncbi:hypothetical protein HU200_042577 [Digitaria exilis]|uniref:Reverse transcriptase zinc-binding domain-containing protein n=1 Tax=Digitaria exilis TaxID=1010633 RepID=A0A835EI31_9POAL|nr:hypothetical protein HU200_042577 [Digitaria exilis]